jgi:hypothetical protein
VCRNFNGLAAGGIPAPSALARVLAIQPGKLKIPILLAERAKSDFLRVHQDLSLKFYLTESHNIVNLHKK